jgi:sugar phosphate isomerase/epimerase
MPKLGAGISSQQISSLADLLSELDVLELEDYLNPAEFSMLDGRYGAAKDQLAAFRGEVVLSGPYIDLNPGSPDALVRETCFRRFRHALDWARQFGAHEIIFCSTFIPIIYLEFYEADWALRCADFWTEFMAEVPREITISLCNTFEFTPRWLSWVADKVNQPNFRLALDLGHFLVYSTIDLEVWLRQTAPYLSTVYVHSNHGQVDEHLPPDQGVLTTAQVALAARYAAPDARFILKPFDKTCLQQNLAWLRQGLAQE